MKILVIVLDGDSTPRMVSLEEAARLQGGCIVDEELISRAILELRKGDGVTISCTGRELIDAVIRSRLAKDADRDVYVLARTASLCGRVLYVSDRSGVYKPELKEATYFESIVAAHRAKFEGESVIKVKRSELK